MKNVLLVFLMPFMMVNLAHSQDLLLMPDSKNTEVAITNISFNGASILLKKQISPNEFRRQSFGAANISLNKQQNNTTFGGSVSYSFGKEYRKNIVKSFDAIYGPQYGLSAYTDYRKNIQPVNNTTFEQTVFTFAPSFGYLLGFIYHINDKFYIGFETQPSISTSVRYDKETNKEANIAWSALNIGASGYLNFTAGFKLK